MAFTVQNALSLSSMSQGTVVAGASGLSHVISSVTVLEIPDDTDFLEPNLLALTSFYAIANDPERQLATVELLNKHHIAGLLVFNVGSKNAVPELSKDLCDLCDTFGLPLIQMPPNISYYNIFYEVMNCLLSPHADAPKTDALTYETYINQLLYISDSYAALLSNFSQAIHHEVAFFNHNHKCVFPESGTIADISCSHLRASALSYLKKHDREYIVTIGANHFQIIPVVHQGSYCGSIVLANIGIPIAQNTRFLIEQTKKALYISVFNSNRMYMHHEKQCSEFFMDLLDGNYSSTRQLISRANELDLRIESITGILVMQLYEASDSAPLPDYAPLQSKFYHRAQQIFAGDNIVNLPEKGQLVVLTSKENSSAKYLPRFSRLFLSELSEKEKPVIGIGPACTGPESIPLCYDKAVSAIHLRSHLQDSDFVANYNHLEVYDILFKSLSHEQAQAIVTPLLAPVRTYDKEHHTQLEETFLHLVIGNKSTSQVAEELFLHKNTVLQRKAKIQHLYTFDPFAPNLVLQFEIAFLLRNLFEL